MNFKVIKTDKDYKKALELIDSLLESHENSKESEELEILSILVEDYESKHYKIDLPDPITAINFRVEQLGLSKRDLEKSLGGRGRVYEVLNSKRNLSLGMIRRLHKDLNIPADILIKETKKSA